MPRTTDDRYFEWLYSHIGSVRNRNPVRSYWQVARRLYATEFVWLVANDDNRIEDGLELRQEFISQKGSDGISQEWLALGCSTLEMMIALSRRAAFEGGGSPGDWYWRFLQNLTIMVNDEDYNGTVDRKVEDILERFIYRNYTPSGRGGLFPLRGAEEDQRKVELWYQLAAYLDES